MTTLRTFMAALLLAGGLTTTTSAQERPGTLTVNVYDTTGAAIAATSVNLTAPDGAVTSQLADEKGSVTFGALLPGKYAVVAEFPGFEPNAAAELQVRAGRNTKQDITLEIAGFVEQVEVEQDMSDRAVTDSFSTALSASQIEALADDPDEMQQQLEQLAGPGARIRVNGFEGGQLPPKSQIREIRFRFDPFAAENHNAGFPRVDIITRPGNGPIRNNMTFGFRDNQLDSRNFFSPVKGQGQTYRYGWSIDGPIVKGRTGFSLNVRSNNEYDVQTIVATTPTGAFNGLVNQPSDRLNVDFNIEHVLTKTHTLRFQFDRDTNSAENLGIGNFDLETRGYSREGFSNRVRVSDVGSFAKKYLNEIRVQYSWQETESLSTSAATTIRVQDQFTDGGAQIQGGRKFWELEVADSLDIPLGKKHSIRTGFELDTGNYIGDELRNFAGTFTFPTLAAFTDGRPNNYSIRSGDPYVEYRNTEAGLFIQDDYRFRKNLLLSFGARYEAQTLIDDRMNIAPRAGMTWSPFKSNKTTVRAGAGIFYDWYETSLYENALRQDGTRQFDTIIRNPGYPNPYLGDGVLIVPINPSIVRVGDDLEHADRAPVLDGARAAGAALAAAARQLLQPVRLEPVPRAQRQRAGRRRPSRPDPGQHLAARDQRLGREPGPGHELQLQLPAASPVRRLRVHARRAQELRRQRADAARGQQQPAGRVRSGRRRHPAPPVQLLQHGAAVGRAGGPELPGAVGASVQHHVGAGLQPGRRHQRAAGGSRPQCRATALAEQHRPASELEPRLRAVTQPDRAGRRARDHGWTWRRAVAVVVAVAATGAARWVATIAPSASRSTCRRSTSSTR